MHWTWKFPKPASATSRRMRNSYMSVYGVNTDSTCNIRYNIRYNINTQKQAESELWYMETTKTQDLTRWKSWSDFTTQNRNNRVEITKLIKLRHRTGEHIKVIKQCRDRGKVRTTTETKAVGVTSGLKSRESSVYHTGKHKCHIHPLSLYTSCPI